MKEKVYIEYVNGEISNYLLNYYLKYHINKKEEYYA